MNKKIMVIVTTAILALGAVTVYAKEDSNINNLGFGRGMMYQRSTNNNGNYSRMADLMRENGFDTAAEAMENRDFNSMSDFMNNMTDEQYNKMIDIMEDNGYESMARMMGSVSREEMLDMHNSMMGR